MDIFESVSISKIEKMEKEKQYEIALALIKYWLERKGFFDMKSLELDNIEIEIPLDKLNEFEKLLEEIFKEIF